VFGVAAKAVRVAVALYGIVDSFTKSVSELARSNPVAFLG
jgi:hypothetical protein